MERRSLQLTPEQWTYLEDLAETHEALAKAGPKTGQPSWRVLVRMVADGDILLTTRETAAEGIRAIEAIKEMAGLKVGMDAEKARVVYKSPP